MSIILRALREARSMIETERAAFIDYHTLRNRGLEPDDQAIRQKYDDVLALIRDAVEAAESAQPVAMLYQQDETGRLHVVLRDEAVLLDNRWHMAGPLYLHPPEPARQPMTDEQRMLLIMAAFDAVKKPIVVAELCMEITRAVEAFHRIGGEDATR